MAEPSTVVGRIVAMLAATSAFMLASCSTEADHGRKSGVVKSSQSGDSVRIETEGVERTVRLAFLEAPTARTSGKSDCLAEESTEYLRSLIPAGSVVEFEEKTAADGSPTLQLFDPTGQSVNATMLESGFVILADAEGSLPDEITGAATRARSKEAGLYSDRTACTAFSVLAAANIDTSCFAVGVDGGAESTRSVSHAASSTSPASSAPAPLSTSPGGTAPAGPLTSADLRIALTAQTAQAARLSAAARWISDNESSTAWRVLTEIQQSACRTTLVSAQIAAERDHARLLAEISTAEAREAEAARVAEEQRLAAEAEAARVAEQQRLAAEAAERDAEAERNAQASEAAEASRQAEAERQRNQSGGSSSGSGSRQSNSNSGGDSSSGSYPGYTGPRCYAPGGKSWKPC